MKGVTRNSVVHCTLSLPRKNSNAVEHRKHLMNLFVGERRGAEIKRQPKCMRLPVRLSAPSRNRSLIKGGILLGSALKLGNYDILTEFNLGVQGDEFKDFMEPRILLLQLRKLRFDAIRFGEKHRLQPPV